MPALYDRLVPILFVSDLAAERDFYVSIGFTVTYEGPEFSDFIAVGCGPVEFGLEHNPAFTADGPDRVLTWQLGIPDVDAVKRQLKEVGVDFREEWVTPREDWKYQVLHARTPNGYHLMLEQSLK